ncbi:ornithine cyclodeaminase [Delftia tsuruhatensis]|uniref:bifunctional Delta(1)-pyrroline-2-carboxylate/Delta(1)-piperideine-2- carboxylate reductase n=1 Tax=Delftia tsuruhatensis TaxID=180282 RepID=UPI001E6AB56F|nr:bifunctional Delta(1)-pyrroline-2-carboxylate/Delta(1)-piperideine-2-carboxylate reductase [Delftia tsuruhatensis]CAB5678186.1 ornithine cyclodeaminase [Delftia tsuruhatensis]CAC9693087.1 ornithine cyclodeaminase [Delftia tsuruhatensis]
MDTTPFACTGPFQVFDAARTAQLLGYPALLQTLTQAAGEYEAGSILSPERAAMPLGQGGVLLSMPATAADLGVHKLVCVQPGNARLGLPTIHGLVTACDARTGRPLFALDGPEVTGRRTAAITLLALRALAAGPPQDIALIGTGTQARHHVQALACLHPQARIRVRGRSPASAQAFCDSLGAVHDRIVPLHGPIPDSVDVVITVTTSTEPVYDDKPRAGRLVIGVGAFRPEMAEIGPATLAGSTLFCDDPQGARHEAGDLLRAGIAWDRLRSLASLLRDGPGTPAPFVFKSVGTGAWDLAAARVAASELQSRAHKHPLGE